MSATIATKSIQEISQKNKLYMQIHSDAQKVAHQEHSEKELICTYSRLICTRNAIFDWFRSNALAKNGNLTYIHIYNDAKFIILLD